MVAAGGLEGLWWRLFVSRSGFLRDCPSAPTVVMSVKGVACDVLLCLGARGVAYKGITKVLSYAENGKGIRARIRFVRRLNAGCEERHKRCPGWIQRRAGVVL